MASSDAQKIGEGMTEEQKSLKNFALDKNDRPK